MLNKVRIGNIDDDVENLHKVRFIHQSDENYPKNLLHMLVENQTVLNDLPAELYKTEANVKIIPDNCSYSLATL